MRRSWLAIAALASAASAQAPDTKGTADDPIVVQGRTAPMVRSYVAKMARPEPGHQIARWNAPVCLKFDGLADKFSSFIRTRIAETAQSVGVTVSPPGCPVDVVIVLTQGADALAKSLVHMHPRRIGNLTNDTLLPPSEVDALQAPHVVRWFTASATVGRDGTPITSQASNGPKTNYVWSDSLIRSQTREDVSSKIILIDQDRLAGVSLNQLADYLAFVTLATPDITADFAGSDSILALFAGGDGARPAGLTGQDRTFLEALYLTQADRTAHEQQGAIRARLKDGK